MWQAPELLDHASSGDWLDGSLIGDDRHATQYLGKHLIKATNLVGDSHGTEELHIFFNEHSFLDLEEDFVNRGGAFGSKTLYLFRVKETHPDELNYDLVEIDWQLTGVASIYRNGKPSIYANLGHTFSAIDAQMLESNEY